LCITAIVTGELYEQLERQAANIKHGSFEAIEEGNPVVPVDVIPASASAPPPTSRKRGRPTKAQAGAKVGSSSMHQPSILSLLLQVA